MVNIDHYLVHQARLLSTGANVHVIKTYIFLYEQAIKLHNHGKPKYVHYCDHYERLLRQLVRSASAAKALSESIHLRLSREQDPGSKVGNCNGSWQPECARDLGRVG